MRLNCSIALRLSRVLAPSVMIVALTGCSLFDKANADPAERMSAQQLYAEARSELDSKRFDTAVKALAKLEARFPFGIWAQQAQLDTAYAHYKLGDRVQALVAIERFIRLNPSSELLDYAWYLKGLINFNEDQGILANLGGQDLSERDPRAARESFEAFKLVVTRFPESRYADDSRARMTYLVNALAGSEVHIARYYFTRGAYLAAVNRAQAVVAQYQTSPAVEEALAILVRSYDKLGMDTQRQDAERILKANFPKSTMLSRPLGAPQKAWWSFWN
ncbi:MAG: outer membrane protein assembly factor BamD [Burkholderiaceae bacterium]